MDLNLLKSKSVLVLALLIASAFTSFSQEETTEIRVLDDVWVSQYDPSTNKEGETDMGITINNGDSRETYLKFDISGLYGKGGLVSASLSILGGQSNDATWHTILDFYVVAYGCSNNWSASTLTWDNRVASDTAIIAEFDMHEPVRYFSTGTDSDATSFQKFIEDAMKKHLQFVSIVLKGKQETPGSRVWISDQGWEPARITVVQNYNLDEPGAINVFIDNITVVGANDANSITVDNGSLQMNALILPNNADNQTLKWTVIDGTGRAAINTEGLLTALRDGTVTVQAEATDGSWITGNTEITISGQNYSWNERNYISNGDFSAPGVWFGHINVNDDGIAELSTDQEYETAEQAPVWTFTKVPYEKKDLDFIFSFKMWAVEDRSINISMFSKNFGPYGISTDAESIGGGSSWIIEHVATTPTWYTFHVNFANMPIDCTHDLNFSVGLSVVPIYMDSVSLMTVDDYVLKAPQTRANSLKVYPNPVGSGNELTVSLAKENERVTIYNSFGQKVMEKIAVGNMAKFNVSGLKKGIYIVRLSDGTNQKFVR
ncbi:MAG: T9SS type A sorting domain-containing protein [Prolixibacteraceae bacterium]|nr:T9SS type A sorting domain-containing protein [Prolixibacteraceae bacterium]